MLKDEYREDLIQIGREGDAMENFVASDHYRAFKEYIVDRLQKQSFETFKLVDPSDIAQVTQVQMMSKMLDRIMSQIDKVVQEGKLAKSQLDNLNQEEDL